MKKVVPLQMHGKLETSFVPSILALPGLAGAFRQRNARLCSGAFFAMAVATCLLTDFSAYKPAKSAPGGHELAERLATILV